MSCHYTCQNNAFFARKRKARRSEFFRWLIVLDTVSIIDTKYHSRCSLWLELHVLIAVQKQQLHHAKINRQRLHTCMQLAVILKIVVQPLELQCHSTIT